MQKVLLTFDPPLLILLHFGFVYILCFAINVYATLLPEPVAPAINTCGILDMSVTISSPATSFQVQMLILICVQ